jgi:mRNA export factor
MCGRFEEAALHSSTASENTLPSSPSVSKMLTKCSANFSFKCHRQTPAGQSNVSNVYSVNAISWHPQHGTFSTAGSDGTFHFWDKDAKHRLKGYPEVGGTIISTSFDRTGDIFAYAVSYDWSKGFANNTQQTLNKVMLHPVGAEECKPRPKAGRK